MLLTVLIAMIIGAQWEQQHSTASHFIDVPYADVTLSTRIGLVAGMLLILFYQKDYLVASIDFARD